MHLRFIYPPLVGKGLGILLNQLTNGVFAQTRNFQKSCFNRVCSKNPIDGDKYEFEEHRYWTECPSNAVMCWVLCRTLTAEEFDVVEFCNTLVCCSAREPSLHQKELIKQSRKLLVYFEF